MVEDIKEMVVVDILDFNEEEIKSREESLPIIFHDIRNAATTLQGFNQIAGGEDCSEEMRKFAQRIDPYTEALRKITQATSRTETNNQFNSFVHATLEDREKIKNFLMDTREKMVRAKIGKRRKARAEKWIVKTERKFTFERLERITEKDPFYLLASELAHYADEIILEVQTNGQNLGDLGERPLRSIYINNAARLKRTTETSKRLLSLNEIKPDFQEVEVGGLIRRIARFYPNHEGGLLELQNTGPLQLTTDPELLEIIMGNLFDNALKYGSYQENKRSPQIDYRLKNEGQKKTCVITVKDFGQGLTPEQIETLLNFKRGERLNEKNITGSGLGLFLCKHLVNKLGGQLKVISEGRGRGSAFSLVLPLSQSV